MTAPSTSSPLQRAREPFAAPGFRALWSGAVLFALGQWTERMALGWFVFAETDSALLTAATTAAHAAPGILIGPVAGAISDRSSRPKILASAAILKASILFLVAALIATDNAPVGVILPIVAISGIGASFNLSSLHTLSGDLVGPARRATAISVVSTGQRAVAAIGALVSGLVISTFGAEWSFILGGTALAISAAAHLSVSEPRVRAGRAATSVLADTIEGLRIVGQVPVVALLLLITVVAEVFGFSYLALLPAVADRLLEVGALGFGGLSAAAGVGSVLGTLFLAGYADRTRLGWLLIGVVAMFGICIAVLGLSEWYIVSLLLVGGVGACAAMTDALQWIMLQSSVEDRLRGRVLGAWNVAIGFGWIGPLALGALADVAGISAAYGLTGGILIVTAIAVAAVSPRIRGA